MLKEQKALKIRLTPFASLAATPLLLTTSFVALNANLLLAQSTASPEASTQPTPVSSNTTVQIDGSSSMLAINQALKQQFEGKFPGTKVNISTGGTDIALRELLDGKVDLAAVGRSLTKQEKAQGLIEVPLTRHKIAMIVGSGNPFTGSLTIEQFAKIFRGEITDWSQVGGSAGPIRLVDRPETSDTRQAFLNYPVFNNAPFKSGANATRLSEDSTEAVVKELGTNGISYAIADQVLNNSQVHVVPMYNSLPTNPKYPFSQPLAYVYKGPEPNPAVRPFLSYATASSNQQVIEKAREADVAANTGREASPSTIASPSVAQSSSPVASPETTAPSTTTSTVPVEDSKGGVPWWLWLLGIPLLGGLLWWLLKNRPAPVAAARTSRIILTPRTCKKAYAYWEVPEEEKQALRGKGGRNLALRLYDVTDIPDMDRQTPHSVQQFDCDERSQDRHLPIPLDNRDYLVELGYAVDDKRWLKLARSEHVRVPACPPTKADTSLGNAVGDRARSVANLVGDAARTASHHTSKATEAVGAAAAVGLGAVTHSFLNQNRDCQALTHGSRIILVPRNAGEAYAYWEVPDEGKLALRRQGGRKLTLRIHDATNLNVDNQPAHNTQQYLCDEEAQDKHVTIPRSDRDYVAELGYLTDDNQWLRLVRSLHVHVPATQIVS